MTKSSHWQRNSGRNGVLATSNVTIWKRHGAACSTVALYVDKLTASSEMTSMAFGSAALREVERLSANEGVDG